MQRAAILIGVDRTGGLPVLRDAASGARRMEKWARSQGIFGDRLTVLTDEGGAAVTIDAIKRAIYRVVDADDRPDQLIVYFSGHGVNIGYGEYWLLTDAPRDSQAAVNVAGSEVLARYCGVPHVWMVSDACRTAAEGIGAQRVTGSEIFPNLNAVDLENPVDQFFACTLGRPALEVRDPNTSAKEFTALYTTAMLDGVSGRVPEVVTWNTSEGEREGLIHPRPLKSWLSKAVSRRIAELNLQTQTIQIPDARIVSDPQAWVSRITDDILPPASEWLVGQERAGTTFRGNASGVATIASISTALLHSVLLGQSTIQRALTTAEGAGSFDAAIITNSIEETAAPFGPSHQNTQCGFKIRGGRFIQAISLGAMVDSFSAPSDLVAIQPQEQRCASVLLVLESGNGVLLPALPQFLCALTVVGDELVDVAYEPSENTSRWQDFVHHADEIRTLRSLASVATRNGVFRVEGDDALALAHRMQMAKGAAPSLAIYASYAYSDLRRKDLLREMSRYMRADLGGYFFDVALHVGDLDGHRVDSKSWLFSYVPLLTQGWALLGAHRVSLPASLEGLREKLIPSAWTLFDRSGVEQIRAAMQQEAFA